MPAALPETLPVLIDVPGVRAFFTLRSGGFSTGPFASLNLGPACGDAPRAVERNWRLLLESLELSGRRPAIPRMCHGATLAMLDDSARPPIPSGSDAFLFQPPGNADAICTRSRSWVLAVTMADCLTALVADPDTGCIAAIHAGWRGTRENIMGASLDRLFAGGLCRPEGTRVAFGPCLSTDALEIGEDVARTLPHGHVRAKAGRFHFDLVGCNRAQAIAAGVRATNLSAVEGCTRADHERFFSHRRENGVTGRMAACIALL